MKPGFDSALINLSAVGYYDDLCLILSIILAVVRQVLGESYCPRADAVLFSSSLLRAVNYVIIPPLITLMYRFNQCCRLSLLLACDWII